MRNGEVSQKTARRMATVCCSLVALAGFPCWSVEASSSPHVLIVTIDTLRPDRLSSYGYKRPTSSRLDQLIRSGVQFTQARTVEPLTSPALCSMFTSLYPHEHGSTRNGLRMRPRLASLPKRLQAEGYSTAAFVGTWTMRDKLSGLGEHFEHYEEVLNRKRWMGLGNRESTADDLTEASLAWIERHLESSGGRPFLLWVHYAEPHAPYRLHAEHLPLLGLTAGGNVSPADRYDTEIVEVDRSVGELLDGLDRLSLSNKMIVTFTSDHGESLGEHDYWGHGRNLYEAGLLVPMSVTWPGHLRQRVIDAPALNIDLAPTLLRLVGLDSPSGFRGYDWTGVFNGAAPPKDRTTQHQAHRGAVLSNHDSDLARRKGLLEVATVRDHKKEIFRVENGRRRLFDLESDPREIRSLGGVRQDPTEGVLDWLRVVYDGLNSCDAEPLEPLDPETAEALRSLGYTD